MQLTPVASLTTPLQRPSVMAAPGTSAAPAPPATLVSSRVLAGPAPAISPVAFEGAVDGAARLGKPILDFPGIAAGDVFDIVKGSKAGPIPVRGEAKIERFDPDHATFHVVAGRFGMKVDVTIDVARVDEDHVRIESRGVGIPDMSEVGRIVEQRTDYAVFEQLSDPSKRLVMARDSTGRVVIDTVIPTIGDTHLELERRA